MIDASAEIERTIYIYRYICDRESYRDTSREGERYRERERGKGRERERERERHRKRYRDREH